MTKLSFLLCTLMLCSFSASAQSGAVNHWETVVYDSSVYHYLTGTSPDPGNNWNGITFNDAGWPLGRGSIGYADGDDRTVTANNIPSVLLRKKFTIADLSAIADAYLHVDYDDGFVAYLNGAEIARGNMDAGVPAYNQSTPTDHEALLYQGIVPERFAVPINNLLNGVNILAIEVHNHGAESSDLTAAAFLSLGINNGAHTYGATPSWFVPPISVATGSSNLPVIVINTSGQPIISDVEITADMGVIDNGPGQRNGFSDPFNNYNGKISIEVHGESSQMFPKKSYHIETHDAAGENLDAGLAGLPPENDWILYAPYSDKSLLRNMLAYTLGGKLGRFYAPRFKFVEVILNGEYNGVYMLVEKIKQDKNRVNISKLKDSDVAGDNLTGGYILRVDKIDPGSYPAWAPVPTPHLPNEGDPLFQFQDPKGDKLVEVQRQYIRNFIQLMENNLSSPGFGDPVNGFTKFIDANSFIDFMLVTEVSKSVDAYVYSTYLYKDRDSKGGKLTMGPLWDFDLGFGNVDYNQNSQTAPGWTYNENYRMFWFRRLMSTSSYADSVKCRWKQLRTTYFSNAWVTTTLDSMASVLGESQSRNFQQWPILGTYVWPNQFVGATYLQEVTWLKNWVTTRLDWMDAHMPGSCGVVDPPIVTGLEPDAANSASLYPNPTSGSYKIQFQNPLPEHATIYLRSVLGQSLGTDEIAVGENLLFDSESKNVNPSSAGMYVVEIRTEGKLIFRSKLIKR